MSEENLPPIPLRPFRNQVGGHSVIYKFTKQAVCKPLVSRENLFYESVEREAPPLLGFIPRYLGVMLVSFRRVPRNLADDSTFQPQSAPSARRPLHALRPGSPTSTADNDPDTELPEVVLDRNRHIVPHWLLKFNGKRSRSLSQSPRDGSIVAQRQLRRSDNRANISTPDLTLHPTSSEPSQIPLSPPEFISRELEAPTPVNSPNQTSHTLSQSWGQRISSSRIPHNSRSDDEIVLRPQHGTHYSDFAFSPPGSPRFGGVGSTVVNNKFKDHVFSNVVRDVRKRRSRLWRRPIFSRHDGPPDAECDENAGSPGSLRLGHTPRRTRGRPLFQTSSNGASNSFTLPSSSLDNYSPCVQSPRSSSPLGKPIPSHVRQDSDTKELGVFDMDLDTEVVGDSHTGATRAWEARDAVSTSVSSPRRRGRSRSFGSSSPPRDPSFSPPSSIRHPEPIDGYGGLAPVSDPKFTRQDHFILMEDLTGKLKRPCIIDLKMGTRQYGMDATQAKKESQRKKCLKTTSRSLGLRVWDNTTQAYRMQDKYTGREIPPSGFGSVLKSFLSDGDQLLVHQIPILLQKLYALTRIVNRLKGYRFYGCSLLLIYDGDREAQESFRSSELENPSSRGRSGTSLERRADSQPQSGEKRTLRRTHSEDLLVGPVAKRQNRRKKRGEINVRIVDFAHTTTGHDWAPYPKDFEHRPLTHSAYESDFDPETGLLYARFPPHYPERPDRGFLFGLKTLTEGLEEIWNKERYKRSKAARETPEKEVLKLPPLAVDGKDIFEEIFGGDDDGYIST